MPDVISEQNSTDVSMSVKHKLWNIITSSNVNISALLAICARNSPVTGEFPSQRPVTQSFDVFYDLRLNKRLSKQVWGWWFETLLSPLWRHWNEDKELNQDIDQKLILVHGKKKHTKW